MEVVAVVVVVVAVAPALSHRVCMHVNVCGCDLNLLSLANFDLCLQSNTLARWTVMVMVMVMMMVMVMVMVTAAASAISMSLWCLLCLQLGLGAHKRANKLSLEFHHLQREQNH